MKKLNTFLKFLETHYPLQDEVHHNIKYDVKVYTTADPLVSPLGDPVTLNKYYDKCIRHIVHKEPWRIQEYLFFDVRYEQGMIMAYRPDSHRKGRWCLGIEMIFPTKRLSGYSKQFKTKKALTEQLVSVSPYPKEALQYVLQLADIGEGLESAYKGVQSGEWAAAVFVGDYGLFITLEENTVKSIRTNNTYSSLTVVEV